PYLFQQPSNLPPINLLFLHHQTNQQDQCVIIVGAGLVGVAAATHLHANNISFLLLEASDAVSGRVRTNLVEGFLLDRGIQIFITAYPEARKLLHYNDLDLRKFYSSARIYYNGEFHTVADPSVISLTPSVL
ncbi:Protoporphyrinogen oxidase, partial [Linum perenne]